MAAASVQVDPSDDQYCSHKAVEHVMTKLHYPSAPDQAPSLTADTMQKYLFVNPVTHLLQKEARDDPAVNACWGSGHSQRTC